MKNKLSKIPTSVLQNEINKRDDKSGQLKAKYGKILKEMKNKYHELEHGERVTLFIAGVRVSCNVYLDCEQPEIEINKITIVKLSAENHIIQHALNHYLSEESYELERIEQVNKVCQRMYKEVDKILETCNKIGKELKIEGDYIFQNYVYCN